MSGTPKNTDDTEGGIVALVTLLLAVPTALWIGFVAQRLWIWFVVPTLHAPPISLVGAMGLSLAVQALNVRGQDAVTVMRNTAREDKIALFARVWSPAFLLLIGWILQRYL